MGYSGRVFCHGLPPEIALLLHCKKNNVPLTEQFTQNKEGKQDIKLYAQWASPHSLLLERFLETGISPKRTRFYTTVPPEGLDFDS